MFRHDKNMIGFGCIVLLMSLHASTAFSQSAGPPNPAAPAPGAASPQQPIHYHVHYHYHYHNVPLSAMTYPSYYASPYTTGTPNANYPLPPTGFFRPRLRTLTRSGTCRGRLRRRASKTPIRMRRALRASFTCFADERRDRILERTADARQREGPQVHDPRAAV